LEIEGKVIHIIIFLGNLKACWKEIFEKYSVLQMKLVADLLENHPFSFLPVMKEALNVICRRRGAAFPEIYHHVC